MFWPTCVAAAVMMSRLPAYGGKKSPAPSTSTKTETLVCPRVAGDGSSIFAMEKAVQEYVPGYRLLQEPQIDDPSPATRGQTKVSVFVEVEGAGDFLPPYAGNLDIMTAAATQVGQNIARSILASGG